MRFFRSALLVAAPCVLLLQADLGSWIQHLPSTSVVRAVFFRDVQLPGGIVPSRRTPAETIPALTDRINATPKQASLYYLRAREAELNLDFALAEASWKSWAELTNDKVAAAVALADFYHRRLNPQAELSALLQGAALSDKDHLFRRALALSRNQALDHSAVNRVYSAWSDRFPERTSTWEEWADAMIAAGQYGGAEALAARFAKRFPSDDVFPTRVRAGIAEHRGSPQEALRVYEAGLRPLSSPAYVARYFQLLERSRSLRKFLSDVRDSIAREPLSVAPATRLFYYHQQGGRLPDAHRALQEFAARKAAAKSPWQAEEQLTLGRLFDATRNYPEAARYYNAAWQSHKSEEGLAALIEVLFTAPEQELGVGEGDLTFYKDIASIDRYPGTLNGILSLLFNSTHPAYEFADQERAAVPYFHRAKAAELTGELEKRFPASPHRVKLRARLIQSYATYGANEAVLRLGRAYLTAFPGAVERTDVALAMADAYARLNRNAEEFRIYDDLLKELGAAAKGLPIGAASDAIPADEDMQQPRLAWSREPSARSGEPASRAYVQVLERYLSRLTAETKMQQALAVYRAEIDRNPNDPGLYERLAGFMAQHRMTDGIADVYSLAMQRFQDRSWHHKLARWYLRQQQTAAFLRVSRDYIAAFSGSELEQYFQQVVGSANLDAALYRELNRFAHTRFPNDLVFVRNLLTAYSREGTADPAAREALLRRFWYYDEGMRAQFFQLLSSNRRLDAELKALEAANSTDPAAVQFVAEGRAWQSHFEEAVKPAESLAESFPGDPALNGRSASLFRSFGRTDDAIRAMERMWKAAPRDRTILASAGDILSEKGRIGEARQWWNRMSAVEPGNPEAWIETATVYWDWLQYDDALDAIAGARERLRNPSAFAWEAGAIAEGQRRYPRAVAEYMKVAANPDERRALRRLLRLAQRRDTRELVEGATKGDFEVRVALLEDQNRRDELGSFLRNRIASAGSMDALERVEEIAERNGFREVIEAAIGKRIAVTADPVERLRLQIVLARMQEDRGDSAGATRILDAAYKAHPETLGVVRAAVDFDWRSGKRDRAIDTLVAAASRSNAVYRRGFLLEAAQKATEAQQYARARELLDPLLRQEPLASDLISAVADTWARAGDDRRLREFYVTKLKEATSTDVQTRLRRGLIPVLTRIQDHAGALNEYIEIARRYPDDLALTREASVYARRHGLQDQLTGFLAKAERESPKDARWPMLMARVQSELENAQAAMEAYTRASALRPDRTDLLAARADLEERTFRFDQAAATYARLYELSYRNPSWMVKSAEAHARRGSKDAAIAALRKAFIEDRPSQPRDYIEMARQLASWNLIREAKTFADQAPASTDPELVQWLNLRLRQTNWLDSQTPSGRPAEVVHVYYTPEEKQTFATALARTPDAPTRQFVSRSAGLIDVYARELGNVLQQTAAGNLYQVTTIADLQTRRGQFEQLAQLLETTWKALPPTVPERNDLLVRAASAWQSAGNTKNELRVLELLEQSGIPGEALQKQLQLLARVNPAQLVTRAGSGAPETRSAAVTAAFHAGQSEPAFQAIRARGTGLPPVWTSAYTALAGYYFDDRSAPVMSAFDAALGPRTVGTQLANRVNRDAQLAGDAWFYYAARFGEFTGDTDYLVATEEGRPASSDAYVQTADWLREHGRSAEALEGYGLALQVDAGMPAAHARMAEILAGTGESAEAVRHWREAFRLWEQMQNGRLPASFWADVDRAIGETARAKALAELRPDIDRVVRTYLRRSGPYRSDELLRAVYQAAGAEEGLRWVVDLSTAAPVRSELLNEVVGQPWLADGQRGRLQREIVRLLETEVASRTGEARNDAQWRLRRARLDWAHSLFRGGDVKGSLSALEGLPDDWQAQSLRLHIAAIEDTLEPFWRGYRAQPETTPSVDVFQGIASSLRSAGRVERARGLMELYYKLRLEQGVYEAANFLGLADVYLERGDAESASAAVRRMMLLVSQPFDTLRPTAQLFEKYGRSAEARGWLEKRLQAVPWDVAARRELAAMANDATQLRAIAADPQAPYEDRAAAASRLRGVSGLGSQELDLLASGNPVTPQQAERPYQFHARVRAAQSSADPAVRARLLRGSLAIRPDDADVRPALARALVQNGAHATAVSVVESEVAAILSEGAGGKDPHPMTLDRFFPNSPERAALALDLSRAYRQLDRPADAAVLLAAARMLQPGAAQEAEITALRDEARVRRQNRSRMPVVTGGVEQPGLVRPRLVASVGGAR